MWIFQTVPGHPSLRPELEKLGEEALYQRLLEKDPEAAEAIHPHNRKRGDPRAGILPGNRQKDFRPQSERAAAALPPTAADILS